MARESLEGGAEHLGVGGCGARNELWGHGTSGAGHQKISANALEVSLPASLSRCGVQKTSVSAGSGVAGLLLETAVSYSPQTPPPAHPWPGG